jgi:hypothetical protein
MGVTVPCAPNASFGQPASRPRGSDVIKDDESRIECGVIPIDFDERVVGCIVVPARRRVRFHHMGDRIRGRIAPDDLANRFRIANAIIEHLRPSIRHEEFRHCPAIAPVGGTT